MHWVVVGGNGFVGSEVCRQIRHRGETASVVDLQPGSTEPLDGYVRCDVLVDEIELPPGRVVLALGRSMPRQLRPWTLVLDNTITTARLAAQLSGRDVTLLSSIEVYGSAAGPLHEDTAPQLPVGASAIAAWCDRAMTLAAEECPPNRAARLCRELTDLDPSGRWAYALAKAAQEEIVRRAVEPERLTVVRAANVVGSGQWRLVGRLVEAMLAGTPCQVTDTIRSFVSVEELGRVVVELPRAGVYNVASGALRLVEVADLIASELGCTPVIRVVPAPATDSCGIVESGRLRQAAVGELEDVRAGLRRCVRAMATQRHPMFHPTLPVVVPPRPEQPDVVADRISAALWSGQLRGGQWVDRLTDRLRADMGCGDRQVVLTNSGTNALRLAIDAVAGAGAPGEVALCPAYTFHATQEVIRQLGYTVRLVDVHPETWTLDPASVAQALAEDPVRLVVTVDALGNPCDYEALWALCRRAGVPLVADSAPALGSRYAGRPIGSQADAHAFSMSFAKVVSGGGSGGAAVLPADTALRSTKNWLRSAGMGEMSAIVALDNVSALEELIARRERVAAVYAAALSANPSFGLQVVRPGNRHSWVHWVTRVHPRIGRAELTAALSEEGVATKPYYEPLAGSSPPAALPVTARLHREALALPMSSELSVDDAERVAAAVARATRRLVSLHGGTRRSDLGLAEDIHSTRVTVG